MQESGVTKLNGVGVLAVSSCSRFLPAILCFFSHSLTNFTAKEDSGYCFTGKVFPHLLSVIFVFSQLSTQSVQEISSCLFHLVNDPFFWCIYEKGSRVNAQYV